ncbi:MAG: HEPN domain-containing protein [Deltaproteobacteria bacterium]|nr:HEPN domain-containing protein [Deltaproteobacteria bacterium]
MTMADYALAQGIFEEAVSSAYYSAHHSARALLFSLGLEVRSHDGLRSLLGEHFVRDGRLPRDTTSKLGDLFVGRLEADYGTHVRFSRERAETSVIWSKEFVEAAARILAPFLTPAARPFRRLPLRGRARARGTDAACIVATRGEKTCSSAQLRAAVRRSAMAGLVKPVGG